jgi:2-polyprenyl-3-methyl-5-hydroxy-6-metoxy-1,4-benzoquinol methylase
VGGAVASCPLFVPNPVKNYLRIGDGPRAVDGTGSLDLVMDWAARWKEIVNERAGDAGPHADPGYWDRRSASFARSTQARADEFLKVVEPFLSPRKTLIDAGAGAGRHAVPLSERLEWVTAVEPSEGMRSKIPPRDNMTIVASTWEDAAVAPADLVICSHVLYGVTDPEPFISKLDRCARERVFIMLRESDLPHPAAAIRARLLAGRVHGAHPGSTAPRMPRFSDLFMLLMQMGIAPDVRFLSYPSQTRYADFDEALVDARGLVGDAWDESTGRSMLEELLTRDGEDLVFDGGSVLSGVAHWQPRAKT